MTLTFLMLSLAILAVWMAPVRLGDSLRLPLWIPLFAASLIAAWFSHILMPIGLAALMVLAGCAYSLSLAKGVWSRRILSIACAILAIALSVHGVPGFSNPLIFDSQLGPDAAPYKLYFNYDKGVVGLLLLALLCKPATCAKARLQSLVRGVTLGILAGLGLMALAWSIGYVRLDIKWPTIALSFLWANLFLTCLAEEAFFRGWLQERWTQSFGTPSKWAWVPVVLSAVLFGAVHLPAGGVVAVLATVAGFIYAGAFARYRQIEVAVLIHFVVNAIHFLGFTYPRLQ